MFFKHNKEHIDLSIELHDPLGWQAGTLKTLKHHLDVTAFAVDPVSGILAIGTSSGALSLFGSPGVECSLVLSEAQDVRVQLLHFAPSLFKLLCVDASHRLHIWDLASIGRPRLERVISFSCGINCLTISPSHTHAFVALSDGEVKTYDLLTLQHSPYTIPNLWEEYQQKLDESGSPNLAGPGSSVIVDVIIHPRDLNLLLIVYAGGVIVFDLKQRATVRAYVYILAPGAPGGSGYHAEDILLPRHPLVTACATHPSGHLFAVGLADGSIAYWALLDEERPLVVQTLDSEGDEDLSAVDGEKLDAAMNSNISKSRDSQRIREPIFKLSWGGFSNSDDPRGGKTVLTVLGGTYQEESSGVTAVLLPPLHPPAPSLSTDKAVETHALGYDTRTAMSHSVVALDSYAYISSGAVQDFWLITKDNPHFSGAWDAQSIVLLSDGANPTDTRAVEAFEFPPPSLQIESSAEDESVPVGDNGLADDNATSQDLASTLRSMALSADPLPLPLPLLLRHVFGYRLFALEKNAHQLLTQPSTEPCAALVPRGGRAWLDDVDRHIKLVKLQQHRVLLAHHPDLSITFEDVSPKLLLSDGPEKPLCNAFPAPLPFLTIEIAPVIADPSLELVDRISHPAGKDAISSVELAAESLECAIVLNGQAVVLFRLETEPPASKRLAEKQLADDELVSLEHVSVRRGLKFTPRMAVKSGKESITACALADVGFLAVGYETGRLLVIDLRGPRVMHKGGLSGQGDRHGSLHRQTSSDPVQSVAWTICSTASDPIAGVRLIANYVSGTSTLYSIARTPEGVWAVRDHPESIEGAVKPLPGGSVCVDAKKGTRLTASPAAFATLLGSEGQVEKKCIWVCAGAKGARCVAGINGERIAKVDWGSKVGAVRHVEIIEKSGACALTAYTERGEALVYSIPLLEHLHTLTLPPVPTDGLVGDGTGDFLSHVRHPSGLVRAAHLGSLFAARRQAPYASPQVDLAYGRGAVPPQPRPVALGPPSQSVLGSLMGYVGAGARGSAVMTGQQIDDLLAGPDRPAPPPPPVAVSTRARSKSPRRGANSSDGEGNPPPPSFGTASSSMTAGVSDLYNRLGSAITERGQMLGSLEDSVNSLEQGSKDMLAQAKRLAATQAAKKWYNPL